MLNAYEPPRSTPPPESNDSARSLASPGRRLAAWAIDAAVMFAVPVLAVITYAVASRSSPEERDPLGAAFAAVAAMWAVLLVQGMSQGLVGATFGKQILSLRVQRADGRIGGWPAAARIIVPMLLHVAALNATARMGGVEIASLVVALALAAEFISVFRSPSVLDEWSGTKVVFFESGARAG